MIFIMRCAVRNRLYNKQYLLFILITTMFVYVDCFLYLTE